MRSIGSTLAFFMNVSFFGTISSFPPSLATHIPSNRPSTIHSEESLNPTEMIPFKFSETTSWEPSLLPTHQPSRRLSVAPLFSSSSIPSLNPMDQSLTSIPTSIPSFTQSLTGKSNFPSSSSPSLFPTVEVSKEPSLAPSIFLSSVTTTSTVFVLYSKTALNETEINIFEEFLKMYIVEIDPQLFIQDVTVTMQQLDPLFLRRLEAKQLITDLDVTGRLIGDHSEYKFTQRVKSILLDKDGYLQSRLSHLHMFQENESNSSFTDVAGAAKPHPTLQSLLKTFLVIGATIFAMTVIAVVVFLVTRSKRHNYHARHEGQFSDPTRFPTASDENRGGIEDESIDTSTIASTSILDNQDNHNQTSTLSYSETSYDSRNEFMMSLTSSSLAASETKQSTHTADLHNIPLQEKRHGLTEDDDDDMQDISVVETEINNTGLNSKKNFSWSFPMLRSRESFARSDRTPKVSNLVGTQKDFISALSTVSSLSDKSSYLGSVSLNGTPYEVLIAGNKPLGLIIQSASFGPQILRVKPESPIHGIVEEGDFIISVDGKDTRSMTAKELSQWLHREVNIHEKEKTFILMSPCNIEENWLHMAKTV
jgi:hypothetical protein